MSVNFPDASMVIMLLVIIVVGAFAAFFLIRGMQGSIEILVPRGSYRSGEFIVGKVNFIIAKTLDVRRLYVVLVGYDNREAYHSNGSRKTNKIEIYRDELDLETGRTLSGDQVKSYGFSFAVPRESGSIPVGQNDALEVRHVINELATASTSKSTGFFRTRKQKLTWELIVRADLPGIDLTKSKRIKVTLY